MLIKNYEMPREYGDRVRVGETADVFDERAEFFSGSNAPSLLVWKGALLHQEIEAAMMENDWALRVLKGFNPKSGWSWKVKGAADKTEDTDWSEIIRKTERACGLDGKPITNIALTLQLKEYEDKTSPIGGYAWWIAQEDRIAVSDSFIAALYSRIVTMLGSAQIVGLDLHIEQITIVISKDENDQVSTLTPTLHSDMFYGVRETALCSLVDKQRSRFTGTLFAPTVRMDTLENERPIDVEKMLRILSDAPIIESNSGDVLLYDGMIGPDGATNTANGIPHISPDLPGQSTRMVLLMRNQARPILTHPEISTGALV